VKKFFVIAMLCVVPISFAGAKPTNINLEKRWYFGGGVNYSFENFKDEMDIGDWDNALGLDIKAGYCITDFFALEFMFQYLDEFKYDETVREYVYISPSWYYYDVDYKATVSLYNFTINGKGFIPLDSIFRPYGVLGLGYAYGEAEQEISYLGLTDKFTEKEDGMCGRFGAGIDIFLSKQFALEGEVSYFMGFGDIDNVRYTTIALNALVLF
jgi:opacity protein-like surface antigen